MNYNTIFYCFVVFVSVILNNVSSLTKYDKYEFDEATGLWYKYHEIPLIFTDAFSHCKAEGGFLASPTNEPLTKSLMSIMSKKNVCGSCPVFTGINAFLSKGDYSTAEGIPLAAIQVSWAPGAPDNFENSEDCLVMLPNGKLDDKRCNDTYPYICYKTMDQALANPTCGTNDKEYALDARTGSCYKFHNVERSWVRAYMICEAEGGYLAVPNSVTEINIYKELLAKNPKSVNTPHNRDFVGLGFHSLFQEGEWLTVKGQTIQEAGYAIFSDNQPDNAKQFDGGEHCGSMYRNGGLNDIYCYSIIIAFICEKDPSYIHV